MHKLGFLVLGLLVSCGGSDDSPWGGLLGGKGEGKKQSTQQASLTVSSVLSPVGLSDVTSANDKDGLEHSIDSNCYFLAKHFRPAEPVSPQIVSVEGSDNGCLRLDKAYLVPAGDYWAVMNDTVVRLTMSAGQRWMVTVGRIESSEGKGRFMAYVAPTKQILLDSSKPCVRDDKDFWSIYNCTYQDDPDALGPWSEMTAGKDGLALLNNSTFDGGHSLVVMPGRYSTIPIVNGEFLVNSQQWHDVGNVTWSAD